MNRTIRGFIDDTAYERDDMFDEIEYNIDDYIEEINDFGEELDDLSNVTIQEALDNTAYEIDQS